MIVYFALGDIEPSLDTVSACECRVFRAYDSFASANLKPDCFIVESHSSEPGSAILRSLRSNPSTSVIPVFLARSLDQYVDTMSDGVVSSMNEALEKGAAINRLTMELEVQAFQNADYRLLGYLYSRSGAILTPVKKWSDPRIYVFLLAESIADYGANVWAWLHDLQERGFIEPSSLIDRLRHCPFCSSAHLAFVDNCPECSSVDIAQKPLLSCFTCGHTSPSEGFRVTGELTCLKCNSKLRQIGKDYDRTIGNFACNRCDSVFLEPHVVANCMSCEKKIEPDNLLIWPIYSFRITDRGRMAAKTGNTQDIFTILDSINYVKPDQFVFLLDWLLALQRRYPSDRFGLLGVRVRNIAQLAQAVGLHKVGAMIDEFAANQSKYIRVTDLTTRTGRHTIWMILPKTDQHGCKMLEGRLINLKANRQDGCPELEFDTVSLCVDHETPNGETAERLRGRMMKMPG